MIKYQIIRVFTLVAIGLFYVSLPCFADEQIGHEERHERHTISKNDHNASKDRHGDDVEKYGGEEAGVVAAIIFIAANLTVLVSVTRRLIVKYFNKPLWLIKKIITFDITQKQYLLTFHYYLNIIGIIVVAWHWNGVKCDKSVLPEVGLIALMSLAVLGFIAKYKVLGVWLQGMAKKIHTQPLITIGIIAVLAVGHVFADL